MRMFENKNNQKENPSENSEPIVLSQVVLKIIAGGSQGCALNINPPKKRNHFMRMFQHPLQSFLNPCG